MISSKKSLIVTECWGTLSEVQAAINLLSTNGTVQNITAKYDGSYFYMRGEGLYKDTINVIPVPTVSGSYKVTNPSGTYKMMLPSWNSPAMPNGWIGVGTLITVIGMLTNEDEKWLVLEKNGGFVNASRVAPA